MSEGEKAMDNRRVVNARQLAVTSPRDVASAAGSKYARQNVGGGPTRRDYAAGRPLGDAVANRKPVQPKARFSDKRPTRFRGPNGSDSKEEVTKVDEPSFPEYGSAQLWGSKKSNLNHLLNFHFESRDMHFGRGGRSVCYGPPGRYGSGRRGGAGCGSTPYNKERFLQANCQFVVREGSDYNIHAVDPDVLVDWDHIEQVRIFGHEVPSCPICLYPPKAAKITRCGHIYCWPCILHYLSLDDKTWRKCPICYESIHAKDLKSVSALETHHYNVGEQITMKLMKKPRGTLRVLPVGESFNADSFPADVNDTMYPCYAKLLSASVSHIQGITDVERTELQRQLNEEGEGTLEGSFISAALTSLSEREQLLQSSSHTLPVAAVETMSSAPDPPAVTCAAEHVAVSPPKHRYVCAFDDDGEDVAEAEMLPSVAVDDMREATGTSVALVTGGVAMGMDHRRGMFEVSSSPAILVPGGGGSSTGSEDGVDEIDGLMEDLGVSGSTHDDDTSDAAATAAAGVSTGAGLDDAFYFYQAADGQHIYMHAVNIHCLVRQYGSLSQCPHVITATIVEMEAVSMDEDIRRRLRYLSHLPLTCEFVMAELDLKPPVVSSQVLTFFTDELQKRKLNRQRRARNENKHATRIQREENRSLGIDPTMRIVRSEFARTSSLSSCLEASPPTADAVTFTGGQGVVAGNETLSCSPVYSDSSSVRSQDTTSTSPTTGSSSSVPSFAQMLKAGKARPVTDLWPKVSKPTGAASCGGGRAGMESDGEEYQAFRRTETSLSDAIQAALDSYHKEPNAGPAPVDSGAAVSAGGATGAGGKKKNKKKLLFSTSLPRTG